jgi:UDP-N-acetylmuramyl pentapeptide phosphotransferase/UDP-N-acetylglucosamine-1-phosphate transferase
MPEISSAPAVWISILLVSFLATAAVVLTGRWHYMLTADSMTGVQKIHDGNTPRVGGLGIYLALWTGVLLVDDGHEQLLELLLLAALPALLFGLLEDVTKRVGIKTRLVATMASGVLAWWLTGYALFRLDIPVVDLLLAYTPVAVVFTAFAVGGVANAINLIDGFNGLASGTLMICLAGLGLLAGMQGDWELVRLSILVGAATLGFFLMNFPFGKIFLGDGGAYMLGFLLAWLAVMVAMRHPDTISPAAVLLICCYPVLETVFSMVRRFRRGHSVDQPDRMHLHSLVYRRLVPKLMRHRCIKRTGAGCNAATAPFLWLFCAAPAGLGVWLHDNTLACWLAIAAVAIAYDTIYRRLSLFKWIVLGIDLRRRKTSDH